jgi:carbon-monoxide dehydrogenase small subunit
MKRTVKFCVNGRPVELTVEPRLSLADCLRSELGLTGTHLGCEQGVCGACTAIVDGEAVRSCLMFAVQIEGSDVVTIEGVSPPSGLSPLQEKMREFHALQCGFCTPGMVIALHHLFMQIPAPGELEIREAISGNICRCTGYQPIIAAALALSCENGKDMDANPTAGAR